MATNWAGTLGYGNGYNGQPSALFLGHGMPCVWPDGTHKADCECRECWERKTDDYSAKYGRHPGHDREPCPPDCCCPTCLLASKRDNF